MRRAGLVALALLVLAAAGLTACADAPKTITLGAIYPVSGSEGAAGLDEARGALLAVERANLDGGVHKQPLKLNVVDVETGRSAAPALSRLRKSGIRLVIGSNGSTISGPASTAAHRRGMLFWETGAVGEQATDNGAGSSFFRMAPMGAGLGRSAIGFVRDQLAPQLKANHPLRYAVTYVDDAYGRAVGLGAVDEAKASKQDVVGVFPYDVYHLDAAALVRRIAATSPDVLVVAAYLDDGVALRKATVDQHVPLLASIGTSSSYCMPEFAQRLGPAAVGLFASDKPDGDVVREDALTSDAQTLLRWARGRFRQRFGSSLSAPALAGFANTWALVHDVLPASAGLRPADVAAAALRVKLPKGSLVNGAGIDLAGPGQPDAGENRASASVIEEWVDPRTMTVVWPPMFAEHPIANIAIQR